jgi:hypothetical protein
MRAVYSGGRSVVVAATTLILAVLLAACGTPDPKQIAREKELAQSTERAAARVYKRPFEVIWDALVASAAERRLTVITADAAAGVLELRNGVTATSAGERIDIRVTRTAEQAVRVEIRSRAVVVVSIAPDWQRLLFGDLEQKIAPRRTP